MKVLKSVYTAIALLMLGTAAIILLIISRQYYYIVIPAILLIWSIYRIVTLQKNSVRKTTFMFNAIENDDYAFNFTEDASAMDDIMLNTALNRIKDIMSEAKQRVLEREKYYELIMNSVRTGIITLNDAGNIYQVNGEALRIFGLSVLVHINQLKLIDPAITKALSEIKAGEKRQLSFGNELGEVSVSLVASEMPVDNRMMKIVAVTDINNELAEKELESWIKLTRVLTHEIMNSLAPITSLSDTLIDINPDKTGNIDKGLRTINTTSKDLISFVESYRKFTHIPNPHKELIAVKPFLERLISLKDAKSKGSISLDVEPEDMLLYADEKLTGQVVMNLIRNAVQASAGAGHPEITVRSYLDNNENTIIEVSNNGKAIPPETAENIFMPFFTTKEDGSGIGLSISRQIMRLHGGSIRLTSNTDEKVTFSLTFG